MEQEIIGGRNQGLRARNLENLISERVGRSPIKKGCKASREGSDEDTGFGKIVSLVGGTGKNSTAK